MSVLFPPSPICLFDNAIEYSKFATVDGLGVVLPQVYAENLLKAADALDNGAYWTEDGVTVTEPATGVFRLTKTAAADKSLIQTMTNWFPAWAGEVSRVFEVKSDDLTALSVTMAADGADAVTSAEVISGNANVAVAASIANITGIDGTLSKIRVSCSVKAWAVSVAVGFYPDKANATAGYVDVTLDQVIIGDQPDEKPRPVGAGLDDWQMAYKPHNRLTADGNGRFAVVDSEGLVSCGQPTAMVVDHATATNYTVSADPRVHGRFTCENTKFVDVMIRYTDDNNYVKMRIHTDRQVQLIKKVSGTPTTVDTGSTLTNAELYRYEFRANGSAVEVFIDDKLECEGTIADHVIVAQGRVEHDLASNDLRVVAESYSIVPAGIIMAGGKADGEHGDPAISMTEADGTEFALGSSHAFMFTATSFDISTPIGWYAGWSGVINEFTGYHFFRQLASGAFKWRDPVQYTEALETLVAGEANTWAILNRSDTHGTQIWHHQTGNEWTRKWVGTSRDVAVTNNPIIVCPDVPLFISRFALLDLSAYHDPEFVGVTDSKTNPASGTTFDCEADFHLNATFTYEAGKYVSLRTRSTGALTGVICQCADTHVYLYAPGWGTLVAQSNGVFTDGVAAEVDFIGHGPSVKVFVDKVLKIDETTTYNQAVAQGRIDNNLATNDIELETHPCPALGGQLGADDSIICPQLNDTFTHSPEFYIAARGIQVPSADTLDIQASIIGSDELTYDLDSAGKPVLNENATPRITGNNGDVTDDEDVTWVREDVTDGEIFTNGVSDGSTSSIGIGVGLSGKIAALGTGGAMARLTAWNLKPLLPFNLPE